MSVSLVLIPLALPAIPILLGLRAALGKEGFQKLIDSIQVKVPTSLASREQLVKVVTAAKLDIQPWAGGLKTHFRGTSQFFTWEFDGQRWYAVFAKPITQEMVAQVINDIEGRSGERIFSAVTATPSSKVIAQSASIPTNFRDEALLLNVLIDAGAKPARDAQGTIRCSFQGTTLRFVRGPSQVYEAIVQNAINADPVFQHLSTLEDDYRRCVQAATYQQIKASIADKNMTLESEDVLEDNSIVLTLNIQEHR